jgi:actin-like ATPase involved in cell morphogenesis
MKLCLKPSELAADIYNTIYLAGGGSICWEDWQNSQKTDLPVYIAEDPLEQ